MTEFSILGHNKNYRNYNLKNYKNRNYNFLKSQIFSVAHRYVRSFFLSQFPIIFLSIKRVFYFVKIKSLISDLSQGTESSVDNICLGMKNGNDKYNV